MASSWETALHRWTSAGLLDATTAQRIREWENGHGAASAPNRLAALAFGFGGLLLIAGAFLFVSSHWDAMAPSARFALVVSVVALLHITGAACAAKSTLLATTLHAAGTASMGAGIFLCGQIFNMAEHWPGALLLWAIGATAALILLRDWPQVLWVAVLVPAWLWGEWLEDVAHLATSWHNAPPAVGTVLLALAYLAANERKQDSAWRRTLSRLGAIALIPACIFLGMTNLDGASNWSGTGLSTASDAFSIPEIVSWAIALTLPFAVAWALRGRQALYLILPLLWSLIVVRFNWHAYHSEAGLYALYAIGAVSLAAWGVKGQRRDIVNLGVLAFALTLVGFYFSSVFDKLGRSLGLIGIGLLFLGGGWLLERLRRNLLIRMKEQR